MAVQCYAAHILHTYLLRYMARQWNLRIAHVMSKLIHNQERVVAISHVQHGRPEILVHAAKIILTIYCKFDCAVICVHLQMQCRVNS